MLLHRSNLDPSTFHNTRQKLVICGSLLIVGGFLPVVCVLGLFCGIIPIVGWIIAGVSGFLLFFGFLVMLVTRILAVVWSVLNYQANSPQSSTTATTTTTTTVPHAEPVMVTTTEVAAVPVPVETAV